MFKTTTTARNALKTVPVPSIRSQRARVRSFRSPGTLFPFFDSNVNIVAKQKAIAEAHAKMMETKRRNPTCYYHVREGEGGVIELPKVVKELGMAAQEVNAVGTAGCRFCACVYIPLDEHHCFLAHIKAWIDTAIPAFHPDHVAAAWCIRDRTIGDDLVEHVIEKLKDDRTLRKFVQRHPQHKERSVIACPQTIWQLGEERTTGYYVVKALQQHFDLDDSHVQGIDIHGFGIDPPNSKREVFTRRRRDAFWHEFDPIDPSEYGWLRVNPKLSSERDARGADVEKQIWQFVYYRGSWMSYRDFERASRNGKNSNPLMNM